MATKGENKTNKKQSRSKSKKSATIKITLTQNDIALLDRYSKVHHITQKAVTKKVLHDFLLHNVTIPPKELKNQLEIFPMKETTLFDFIKEDQQ